jgi:hypothetical protein
LADRHGDATLRETVSDSGEDPNMAMADVMRPADPPAELLPPGTRVEVRNRLDGRWSRGFEVIDGDAGSYRLRRLSDGGELPLRFSDDDIRREKKRGTWWY